MKTLLIKLKKERLLAACSPCRHGPDLAFISFVANLLEEWLPDLFHGQAIKEGKLECGSQSRLAFLFVFDGMQGGNGKTGPFRNLLQGQAAFRPERP
ncbi:MAG TPA: hypothetical protein VLC12_07210 [Terriglobales bacterium]|nr:hypothetical protein [Terriglobales bacterium]